MSTLNNVFLCALTTFIVGCDSDSDDESYYEASEEEPVLSDSPSSGGVDIYRDSRWSFEFSSDVRMR